MDLVFDVRMSHKIYPACTYFQKSLKFMFFKNAYAFLLFSRVLTLFTALLFSKSFHWLCQSRVEYVESDTVSRYVRFFSILCTNHYNISSLQLFDFNKPFDHLLSYLSIYTCKKET